VQRGVGVHQLALIDTDHRKKFMLAKDFSNYFSGDTSSFLNALPAHESVR